MEGRILMPMDYVKEIMKAFKDADLTKMKFKCDEFEIELEKQEEVVYTTMQPVEPPVPTTIPTFNSPKQEAGATEREIKAPMVGTFYASSAPHMSPFVSVGTKVKKGDVICIVEAMKLMNEVESDSDGEIVAILVENGDMVEFDQPMFIIK